MGVNMQQFNPDYSIDSVDYIQKLIESRNITYKELALLSKIPEETIYQIFNRKLEMSYGISFLIANALHIDHDILLNLDLNHKKFLNQS